MKKFTALLLTVLMCLSCLLVSCGPTEPGDTTTAPVTTTETPANPAIAAIAGDYLLDAKPFGMAMSWYVRINADETFKISTKRDFSVDKGHGAVTESNGTFVFVYSDGTANEPKTATFTVVDGNLVFSTAVPVGAATVSSNEAENPVTAFTMAHEELFGEYVGTYEKQSAMGTTLYEYSLVLAAGRKYTFTSSFTMEGTTYTLVETGSFAIDGTTFTITPKTMDKGMGAGVEAVTVDPISGTLENGVITAAFQPSFATFGARYECTAQKATTAEVAGIYAGQKVAMGGAMVTQLSIQLDKFGGYQYVAVSMAGGAMGGGMPGMSEPSLYGEQGTFTFTDNEIVLTKTHDFNPMDSEAEPTPITGEATPVTLTRGALSVSGSFPTAGPATEATLYHESILTLSSNDIFTAECTAEEAADGVARTAELTLNVDATFKIQIKVDDAAVYTVEGSFTVSKNPMTGTQLSLTLADESATLVGMVADGMINITGVPVDGNGTEISFGFSR